MSTNIDLSNTIPDLFIMDDPQTGSKSVLRKQLIEVNSVDRIEFEPGGQNQIRIKITSPSDFLIGNESYLKFDLAVSGQSQNTINYYREFPIGGAHNLFSRIQVRTLGRGTVIQEVDYYNEYQAIEHLINMDKSYVEQFGPLYGEYSMESNLSRTGAVNAEWIKSSVATSTIAATRNVARVTHFTFTTQGHNTGIQSIVQVGSRIVIYDDTVYYYGVVVGAGDGVMSVVFTGAPKTTEIALGAVIWIQSDLRGGYFNQSRNCYIPSTGLNDVTQNPQSTTVTEHNFTFCMQPFLTVLQQNLPLFLFKDGIELILDLNKALHAFNTADTTLTYTISDVRYMCMMVTPHPSIQESYEQMWRSNKGLVYDIPSVRVKRQTQAHQSSVHTVQWHVGCRSAICAVVKQTDTLLVTKAGYDVTMSHGMNLEKYQFHVGSIMFPQREVELGYKGEEAFRLLMDAFNKLNAAGNIMLRFADYFQVYNASFSIGFGYSYDSTAANLITDSCRTYVGVKFARVDGYGGSLSGIDLTNVPLEMRFTRGNSVSSNARLGNEVISSSSSNLQFTLFVWYNAYLNVNSERISILS